MTAKNPAAKKPVAKSVAKKGLSPRQQDVLNFIVQTINEKGVPPTLREMGDALGIASTNGVNDHIEALVKKGYLKQARHGSARGWVPTVAGRRSLNAVLVAGLRELADVVGQEIAPGTTPRTLLREVTAKVKRLKAGMMEGTARSASPSTSSAVLTGLHCHHQLSMKYTEEMERSARPDSPAIFDLSALDPVHAITDAQFGRPNFGVVGQTSTPTNTTTLAIDPGVLAAAADADADSDAPLIPAFSSAGNDICRDSIVLGSFTATHIPDAKVYENLDSAVGLISDWVGPSGESTTIRFTAYRTRKVGESVDERTATGDDDDICCSDPEAQQVDRAVPSMSMGEEIASPVTPPAESLARLFHETYERLAPSFSCTTRKASAVPWSDMPENNKALMIATAEVVLREMSQ